MAIQTSSAVGSDVLSFQIRRRTVNLVIAVKRPVEVPPWTLMLPEIDITLKISQTSRKYRDTNLFLTRNTPTYVLMTNLNMYWLMSRG